MPGRPALHTQLTSGAPFCSRPSPVKFTRFIGPATREQPPSEASDSVSACRSSTPDPNPAARAAHAAPEARARRRNTPLQLSASIGVPVGESGPGPPKAFCLGIVSAGDGLGGAGAAGLAGVGVPVGTNAFPHRTEGSPWYRLSVRAAGHSVTAARPGRSAGRSPRRSPPIRAPAPPAGAHVRDRKVNL